MARLAASALLNKLVAAILFENAVRIIKVFGGEDADGIPISVERLLYTLGISRLGQKNKP